METLHKDEFIKYFSSADTPRLEIIKHVGSCEEFLNTIQLIYCPFCGALQKTQSQTTRALIGLHKITVTALLNNKLSAVYNATDYGVLTSPDRLWIDIEGKRIYILMPRIYSYTVEDI